VSGRNLIFLIGYRGAGKTTVAKLLAEKLGWGWIDADALLEKLADRSIREIFAEDGEASFRNLEAGVMKQHCTQFDKHVIATGGGVVLREENRTLMKQGVVVWLKAPAEVLWQRMQNDATTRERRPDLAQGGLAEIEELLRVREPLYEACQKLTIDAGSQTPQEIAAAIHAWTQRSTPAT
jgi:shikimate kinase